MTTKRDLVRTCVGCRQRHPAQVLMRVRLHDNALVVGDQHARSGGRGAWLCRETLPSCLKNAVKISAFDRAFRRRIPSDVVDAFVEGFPRVQSG